MKKPKPTYATLQRKIRELQASLEKSEEKTGIAYNRLEFEIREKNFWDAMSRAWEEAAVKERTHSFEVEAKLDLAYTALLVQHDKHNAPCPCEDPAQTKLDWDSPLPWYGWKQV